MIKPINIKTPKRTRFITQIEDALKENALKSLSAITNNEDTVKVMEGILAFSQAIGSII